MVKVLRDIPYLSASRVNIWEKCKHQFFLSYLAPKDEVDDNVIGEEDNEYFTFGTIVHESIEDFWNAEKRTIKVLLEAYENKYVEHGLANREYFTLGKDILRDYFRYLIDDAPKRKFIAQELEIDFKIGDTPIKGRIDSIFYLGNGVYEIVDYKTNNFLPTQEDVDSNIQLAIYDIALREDPNMQKYWVNGEEPKAVLLTLHFLKHYPMHTEYSSKQRKANRDYLQIVYKQMQILREEQFVAQLNKFCNWCSVSSECSLFQSILKDDENDFVDKYDLDDFSERILAIDEAKNRIKILQEELAYLEDELIDVFKDCTDEEGSIVVADREYYLHQSSRRNLNMKKTINILDKAGLWEPEKLINYLPISKVEEMVDGDEDIMFKIERKAMFRTPGNVMIKSKKAKR